MVKNSGKEINKKEFVKKFELMILYSKAKVFSELSLQRPLSNAEFLAYKQTFDKIKELEDR